MIFVWLLLIVPGLLVAYLFFLRPVLKAIPKFKQFYIEADGFWAKVSALGGHSASIAWGYVLMLVGLIGQMIEPVANMLGDPGFKDQLTQAFAADPKILGYILMGISAITIAARLRSLVKD